MTKHWTVLAVFILLGALCACAPGSSAESKPPEPEVTLTQADLEPLPGTYANKPMGFAFKVDLVEGRLRLTMTEGQPRFPSALLIPVSPTRFRWEGEGLAPGLMVAFKVTEGKATAFSIIQPGKDGPMVMKRLKEPQQEPAA